jgi:hypothetical protein
MNEDSIPLYASQPVLQTLFRTNNDGCGMHIFTQLNRVGNICLYRRNRVSDGTVHTFEVINSRACNSATTDSYPEASTFGTRGWSYRSESAAEATFDKLVLEESRKLIAVPVNHIQPKAQPAISSAVVVSGNTVISSTTIVPTGEFTQADFARSNGLPERGSVYNLIQKMVGSGAIRVSRREKRGPGRETVLYVGA